MTLHNPFARTALLAACAMAAPLLHAQITATAAPIAGPTENERIDISAGAAYGHFNPGYAHQVRATNLIGFRVSSTAWLKRKVGVEGDLRYLQGNYDVPANDYGVTASTSPVTEYLFLFGPSFRLLSTPRYTAGMHVLVGGAHGTFDSAYASTGIQPYQIGVYNDQLAWAFGVGGWADYKLGPRWAVRATGDYQPTRYAGIGQNEPFAALGLVYKWGTHK